jgi:hypothetical protein
LGVVRGADHPTLEKFTVTIPRRRPRPTQGCSASREGEEKEEEEEEEWIVRDVEGRGYGLL